MTGVAKCLLGLVIAATGPAVSPRQTPAPAPVAESVRRALTDYQERLNRGDYPGALKYYADDPRFIWVEHDKVVARSKAEIAKGYEKLKGTAMQMSYEAPLVTVLSPDAALVTTGFTAQMGSGAQAAQFSGMLTLVLIRTEAGWRFLSGRS